MCYNFNQKNQILLRIKLWRIKEVLYNTKYIGKFKINNEASPFLPRHIGSLDNLPVCSLGEGGLASFPRQVVNRDRKPKILI